MKQEKAVTLIDSNHISSEGLKRIIGESSSLYLQNHYLSSSEILDKNGSLDNQIVIYHQIGDPSESSNWIEEKISKNKFSLLAILPLENTLQIQRFWKIGASSIVTNACSSEELSTALEMVANGQRFYCNRIIDVVSKPKTQDSKLSERETEVLKQLAEGKTTQEIAESLFVSVHTINSHRKNIMKKLGFKSPVEMIVYAVKNDILNS